MDCGWANASPQAATARTAIFGNIIRVRNIVPARIDALNFRPVLGNVDGLPFRPHRINGLAPDCTVYGAYDCVQGSGDNVAMHTGAKNRPLPGHFRFDKTGRGGVRARAYRVLLVIDDAYVDAELATKAVDE